MKTWYTSKTLWINIIGTIAMFVQLKFGWVISPEYQAMILGGINLILRTVTKKEIVWTKDKE